MAQIPSKTDGKWVLDIPVSTKGDITKTFNTAGTYVDANIQVNVKPTAGVARTPATTITANPSVSSTASGGKYTISVSKTQSVTPETATNGVIDSTTTHTAGTITVSGSTTVDESTIAQPTTTDPGSQDATVSADTVDRWVKVTAGYDSADRYIKIPSITGQAGVYSIDAGADKKVTPVIGDKASQSITGKTQLTANTTIDSTAVTTDYYMAVQTPEIAETVTATATIDTAGYISTGSKTDTTNVGSNASAVTYISVAKAGQTSSIDNNTNAVTVGTKSGNSYPLTNTMVSKITTSTAGWTQTGTGSNESHSGTQVGTIAAANLGSEGSVSSAPSVAVTTTPNGIVTVANSDYSVDVSATPTNGTVQTKYKATSAGYTPTVSATNGGTVTVTPSTSGTGTTYIQAGVLKGEVVNNTAGSASMTPTSVQEAQSGTHYITLNTTAGSVKAKASASTEGYVKTQTNTSTAASVNVAGNGTKFYIKDATTTQGTTTASYKANKSGSYKTQPGGGSNAGTYSNNDALTITEVASGMDDSGLWGKVADNKWIILADVTATVSRGTEVITEGYIEDQTLAAAAFKSSATSGKTYVDISATDEAPILTSNGYLYIDKGYTDYVKISLSKLVPDGAGTAGIAAGDILLNHSAYNANGQLITGTIPNLQSTDISAAVSGTNYVVSVPSGKYTTGSTVTKTACAVYQGVYS